LAAISKFFKKQGNLFLKLGIDSLLSDHDNSALQRIGSPLAQTACMLFYCWSPVVSRFYITILSYCVQQTVIALLS